MDKPENLGTDSLKQTDKDRIDLGHEQSGAHTGRIQRFLSDNIHSDTGENSKKKKQERATDMLAYMLINDPLYAAAFKRLENTLEQAYQAVDEALLSIEQRLAKSVETLQKIDENAAKLEDGTTVFRDVHGNIFDENGKTISAEDAQNIHIPDGAPSWEEYKAAKDEAERLRREREEIERYRRDVLDDTSRRMYDRDNPIRTREELEKEEERIREEFPPSMRNYYKAEVFPDVALDGTQSNSVAQDIKGQVNFSAPDLARAFDKVKTEAPDDLVLPGLPAADKPLPSLTS